MANHSYFVVAIDYGKRGIEAVVDPEVTRREVISRIASGEYSNISFVHHIHDGICEDVTERVMIDANYAASTPSLSGCWRDGQDHHQIRSATNSCAGVRLVGCDRQLRTRLPDWLGLHRTAGH
jgi:hypothetical protein